MNARSLYERMGMRWLCGGTPLAFSIRVLILVPVLTLVTLTDAFKEWVEQPLVSAVASVSHGLLNLVGAETTRQGPYVFTTARSAEESFTVEIVSGCTGLFPYLLFLAAVVAFPAAWKAKVRALLIGAVIVGVLNQIRIVSLFFIGRRFPELFEDAHVYVWQGIVIIIIAFYWYLWAAGSSPQAAEAES